LKGLDFRIAKTSKGGFADYSTSKWSRRERALSDVEKAAIDSHGLFDLSGFLPKKPTDVELKVIKEMFEASVDGEAFDMDRWGQYFKPAGYSNKGGDNQAAQPAARAVTPTPVAEAAADAAPWDEEVAAAEKTFSAPATSTGGSEASSRAQDILAKIKARSNQ
jgi:hypothetical protein